MMLALLLSALPVAAQETENPLRAVAAAVPCEYTELLNSSAVVAGESVSDWIAIASGCSADPVRGQGYLQALEQFVSQAYQEDGCLHRIKATEWHRISLAVLSLGGDPTCFGTDGAGNPIDLIADGTYNWTQTDSLGTQGLNGWLFALITLDAVGYTVPENANFTREDMITTLLNAQTEAGGFGLSAGSPDVDITAMTLQALAPYVQENALVADSVERALSWLSQQQNSTGDFTSWGFATAEGTAQTVIALCALGIDPEHDSRFIKEEGSALDGLLRYQLSSGLFCHTLDGTADTMATEQAALALFALRRFRENGTRLYELTNVEIYPEEPALEGGSNPGAWIAGGAAVLLTAGAAILWSRRGKKKDV